MSAASGGKKGRKFYAVKVGRGGPGVFDTWAECEARVKGFAGAVHKSFATLQEAQNFAGVAASAVPGGAPQLPHTSEQEQNPYQQDQQPNKRFKADDEHARSEVWGIRPPTSVVPPHAVLHPPGESYAQHGGSRESSDVERAMSDLEAALQERRQQQYGGQYQAVTAPAHVGLPQHHEVMYQQPHIPGAGPPLQQHQQHHHLQPSYHQPYGPSALQQQRHQQPHASSAGPPLQQQQHPLHHQQQHSTAHQLLPKQEAGRVQPGAGSACGSTASRHPEREQQGDEVSPEEAERRRQQSLAILPAVMETAHQAVQGVTHPIDPSHSFMLHFDGASRGNPGIAGSGAVLVDSTTKQEVVRLTYPFSVRTTNNVAEWCALILGLAACKELGVRNLACRGDSKLVINQLQNKWRVHKQWLQPLHERGRQLASWFYEVGGNLEVEHVLRDQNKVADALSNIACDRAAALLRG